MLGKISEINIRPELDVETDFSSDENVLLNKIIKRKKQESTGDKGSPEIQGESEIAARKMMNAAYGRRGYQTEPDMVKHGIPASSGQEPECHQQAKGEKRFPVSVMLNTLGKTMPVGKTEPAESATENKSPENSEMPLWSTMRLSPVVFKPCPPVLNIVKSRCTDELGTPKKKSAPLDQQKRFKDKAMFILPLTQAPVPQSLMAEEQVTRTLRMPNMSRRLQNLASLAAQQSVSTNNSQILELNYRFQRWRGEHSVRITIPSGIRRVRNLTMQPSGMLTADVLLRHVGQLDGLSPEFLEPLQDEEQE